MGIERYNIAICDKCKREYRSNKTQQALKKELIEKGWSFKGENAFCSNCSGIKIYTGAVKAVLKLGEKYYVQVSNGAMDVYILYDQFILLNGNSLPSISYLREHIKKKNTDPDRIKYKGTRKETIDNKTYFIADVYFD